MDKRWYAIWTRSRHEKLVEFQLHRKSFDVFLPKVMTLGKWKDRWKKVEKPLFPGYLFIHAFLDYNNTLEILKTKGVVNVLGSQGDYVIPVPDYEIRNIKLILQGGENVEKHPYLKVGQMVKVIKGPFQGVIGRILESRGRQRLLVSLELLIQSVSVNVEKCYIVPYNPVESEYA